MLNRLAKDEEWSRVIGEFWLHHQGKDIYQLIPAKHHSGVGEKTVNL